MNKEELKKKIEERVFGEYKNEVKVVMPKKFLINLSNLINKQNEQISKIVASKDKKSSELLEELVEENHKTRELTGELGKAIALNKIKSVEISNFPEQEEIKIPQFPSKIEISKPKWYERFNYETIGQFLKEGFSWHAKQSANLDKYQEVKNALAVRLVDKTGKSFYDAFFQAIQGGGFGNVTIDNFPDDYPSAANNALLATIDADTSTMADWDDGSGNAGVTEQGEPTVQPNGLKVLSKTKYDVDNAAVLIFNASVNVAVRAVIITNVGDENIYLYHDNTAGASIYFKKLASGENWEFPIGYTSDNTNDIWAERDSAQANDDVYTIVYGED